MGIQKPSWELQIIERAAAKRVRRGLRSRDLFPVSNVVREQSRQVRRYEARVAAKQER